MRGFKEKKEKSRPKKGHMRRTGCLRGGLDAETEKTMVGHFQRGELKVGGKRGNSEADSGLAAESSICGINQKLQVLSAGGL